MSVQVLIVIGPQGCGKSQLAKPLAELYRLENVVDEWDGKHPSQQALTTVPGGCLVLTSIDSVMEQAAGVKVVSFEEARALVSQVRPIPEKALSE